MADPAPEADALPQRPVLTMPEPEAAHVAGAFAEAGVILEYGAGGSTVLAAEMPGKTVFSVESDPAHVARLQDWFAVEPPRADVRLHHADIGPTVEWGRPADERAFRRWPGYPISVWDRPDFLHPDVVLIDGRFRVACLLTTAFRITRPVVALVDDYRGRKPYHAVEPFLRPAMMIGRMARFDLEPTPFPVDRLGWVMNFYMRPV